MGLRRLFCRGGAPAGSVELLDRHCGPPERRWDDDAINLNDEWVRFTNTGPDAVDMTGWMVKDTSASHRYTFGPFVLASQAAVTLHTGCGTDTATDRYWCNSNDPVWNNGGDTVYLTDPAGNIVASYTY